MRITVEIPKQAALLAGVSEFGRVTKDLCISDLSSEQRKALAGKESYKSGCEDSIYIDGFTGHDLSLASLAAYANTLIEKEASAKAQTQGWIEAEYSRAVEELAKGNLPYVSRNEVMERLRQCPRYAELKRIEEEKRAEQANAEKEARARRDAEAETRKQEQIRERDAWIAEHGSDYLKRCFAEKYDIQELYENERLSMERPGWKWWQDVRGNYASFDLPPEDALKLLDECRKIEPGARLVFVQGIECDDGKPASGFTVSSRFMGQEIVFGNLWE